MQSGAPTFPAFLQELSEPVRRDLQLGPVPGWGTHSHIPTGECHNAPS